MAVAMFTIIAVVVINHTSARINSHKSVGIIFHNHDWTLQRTLGMNTVTLAIKTTASPYTSREVSF
jgi:hypothetical protein